MATKLLKSVKRELLSTDRKGKKIIVVLEPGDVISFRAKGTRQSYDVSLTHCFVMAQIITNDNVYKEKLRIYNEKKKAGFMRIKKPKKLNLPFNRIYFEALK